MSNIMKLYIISDAPRGAGHPFSPVFIPCSISVSHY